jgi:O-antigen ligase
MLLAFVATGPSAGLRFAKIGLLGAVLLPVLFASPAGKGIIDYLPFVGRIDEGGLTYRELLFDVSIDVIKQNPFFGAPDVMLLPVMQQLKQGLGIIDIVNTYLGVALEAGLVGLSFFAGFFIAVAVALLRSMMNLPDGNDELHLLGRVLFSTLLGILVMLASASSISVIPVIYCSVAGLGVAYVRMLAVAKAKAPQAAPPATFQRATTKIGT